MCTRTFTPALLTLLALAAPAPADEVRGVVGKIDAEKKELTLEARGAGKRGQTFTFTVAADAPITVNRQAGTLADLTAGRRARVTFEKRDGKFVATSIASPGLFSVTVETAPARAAAAAPAAADTVAGELRRVALADRELVVIPPGTKQEIILAVPEDVTVTKAGKPARYEDLREGEQAVVRVGQRDGKPTALSV